METTLYPQREPAKQSFFNQESACDYHFFKLTPLWHLCTNGNTSHIIFTCAEEYKIGINLLGESATKHQNVKILTFALMSNHFHFILSGKKEDCLQIFDYYIKRIRRVICRGEKCLDESVLQCKIIPIEDIRALRSEIAYVNRNGYVASRSVMPHTYYWGAGFLFFNSLFGLVPKTSFASLPLRSRREICHDRVGVLPKDVSVVQGVITPDSFCNIREAESIYRDANQYYNFLSKNYEAYSQIAKRLGDSIFLSDDDMYYAISSLCAKEYGEKRPQYLPPNIKIEVARRMRSDYNASNKQIQRILKLSEDDVNELFPKAR